MSNQRCISAELPVFFPQLFYIRVIESVRCLNCKKTSSHIALYPSLTFTIPPGDDIELRKCLALDRVETVLTGDQRYHCSQCNSLQDAVRSEEIVDLPPILILTSQTLKHTNLKDEYELDLTSVEEQPVYNRTLQLKRLYSSLQTFFHTHNIQTRPILPRYAYSLQHESNLLELHPLVKDAYQTFATPSPSVSVRCSDIDQHRAHYSLVGLSLYHGSGEHGHYTAVTHSDTLQKWVYYNDSSVKIINDEEEFKRTVNMNEAYLYVFLRDGFPRNWHIPFLLPPPPLPLSPTGTTTMRSSHFVTMKAKRNVSFSLIVRHLAGGNDETQSVQPTKQSQQTAVVPTSPIVRSITPPSTSKSAGRVLDPLSTPVRTPTHGVPLDFSCPHCTYHTPKKGNLQRHQETVHEGKKPLQCFHPSCDYRTSSKQHLHEHEMTHFGLSVWRCNICNTPIKDQRHVKAHLLEHMSQELARKMEPFLGQFPIVPSYHPGTTIQRQGELRTETIATTPPTLTLNVKEILESLQRQYHSTDTTSY